MPTLTTHVLDTSSGRPATGLSIRLERLDPANSPVAAAVTDQDGRVRDWLPDGLPAGGYRLVFETGAWFKSVGRSTLFPQVVIHLQLEEGEPHYHVPLLLSPYGFSSYRGS